MRNPTPHQRWWKRWVPGRDFVYIMGVLYIVRLVLGSIDWALGRAFGVSFLERTWNVILGLFMLLAIIYLIGRWMDRGLQAGWRRWGR